jgi:phenylpropionate dioxygenase-like ring-hydroxylating dioxygenase large terminal subunit
MVAHVKKPVANGWVDLDQGLVSREIFVSDEIYQQELEKVFARAWLFVGHESQIAKPGDFFVSSMGEESVILCRDREGKVHVFLNSCMHRGMKVCRYDEGNTPVFSCPYHGWSYGTDGKLVGVPYFKQAYHERLDKSLWGLIEVPQMANYQGAIFATWDPAAPAFEEYAGGMLQALDLLLRGVDGSDAGAEVYGGVQKWTLPSNWKFPAENFVGDYYHGISHRSVDLTGMGPSGRGRRDTRGMSVRMGTSFLGGHGTHPAVMTEEYIAEWENLPAVSEYFREANAKAREKLGDKARVRVGASTTFPNMSFAAGQPRTIAVWHPRGALKTEAWRWYLVDKAAPQEVKDAVLDYFLKYGGPGGLTEQDDMENWNYASAASKGTIARRYSYNYQMGMGFESTEQSGPWAPEDALFTPGISEQNQRGFYRRWSELMHADTWSEVPRVLVKPKSVEPGGNS